jgi:hypothetical protein
MKFFAERLSFFGGVNDTSDKLSPVLLLAAINNTRNYALCRIFIDFMTPGD